MAQPNVPSALITDQENETLFTLIGSRKQSKATAVVQMFHANADSRSEWTKFKTGVVCFVKDNPKKSYYIRLYDLATKSMVYEQEIYNQFTYSKDRSFFHSFPADKIMVGLNFASEDEANKFYAAVTTKLEERERRATIKRSKEGSGNHSSSSSSVGMNQPQMIKAPINAVDSGADHSNPFSGSSKKQKPRKPKGKISKSDIGAPSDFRHLSHVGYDPSTGNFDSSNINPDWKQLLDTVGVTNEDLKNKDTATFIYDFVEKHGGIQEATKQLREASSNAAPPPPPPSKRGGGGRDLPPPPSKNRGAPPPPPPSRSGAPPPPPPAGGGPAPPPPPPPPPIGGPAPPPPPPVRAGGGSSPPPRREKSNSNLPAVSDSRSDLLASIRKGTQLKRVTDEGPSSSSSPPPEPGLDGMAGALMRALAQRKTALKNSDSESETDSVVNDDDFDWSD